MGSSPPVRGGARAARGRPPGRVPGRHGAPTPPAPLRGGAAGIARTNARALGFADRVLVRAEPVEWVLITGPATPAERVGLVFVDPPYDLADERLADVLALLVRHTWLAPDALVVVERSGRSAQPRWPAGLSASGERRYGETKVWFADAPGPDEVA